MSSLLDIGGCATGRPSQTANGFHQRQVQEITLRLTAAQAARHSRHRAEQLNRLGIVSLPERGRFGDANWSELARRHRAGRQFRALLRGIVSARLSPSVQIAEAVQ